MSRALKALIRGGDPTLAEQVLANRSRWTDQGMPIACYAAKFGNVDVLRGLEACQPDALLERAPKTGVTALHLACEGRHVAAAALLMGRPQLQRVFDLAGWLPVHRAAFRGTVEILDALRSSGDTFALQTQDGLTVEYLVGAGGRLDAVRWLLSRSDSRIGDLVCGAAAHGRSAVLHIVRGLGHSLASEAFGISSFVLSLHSGHLATVRIIAAAVPNPGAADECGQTPLMYAAGEGDVVLVRTLLDLGIDSGFTEACQLAQLYHRDDVLEVLTEMRNV